MYYVEMKVLVQVLSRMAGQQQRLTPADVETVVLEATLDEVVREINPGSSFTCYLVGATANRAADALYWDDASHTLRVLWRDGHLRSHGRKTLTQQVAIASANVPVNLEIIRQQLANGQLCLTPFNTAHWLRLVQQCQQQGIGMWQRQAIKCDLQQIARDAGRFRPDICRAVACAVHLIDGTQPAPTVWQQVRQWFTDAPAPGTALRQEAMTADVMAHA